MHGLIKFSLVKSKKRRLERLLQQAYNASVFLANHNSLEIHLYQSESRNYDTITARNEMPGYVVHVYESSHPYLYSFVRFNDLSKELRT